MPNRVTSSYYRSDNRLHPSPTDDQPSPALPSPSTSLSMSSTQSPSTMTMLHRHKQFPDEDDDENPPTLLDGVIHDPHGESNHNNNNNNHRQHQHQQQQQQQQQQYPRQRQNRHHSLLSRDGRCCPNIVLATILSCGMGGFNCAEGGTEPLCYIRCCRIDCTDNDSGDIHMEEEEEEDNSNNNDHSDGPCSRCGICRGGGSIIVPYGACCTCCWCCCLWPYWSYRVHKLLSVDYWNDEFFQ